MKFDYITEPVNGVQAIFRVLSTLIARPLGKTKVTPNQVTGTRTLIVLGSLYLFAVGEPAGLLWAVFLFYVFEVLDHVDGDLARLTNQRSRAGPLLEQFVDTWSSRPSNVFGLCVATGMYQQTGHITGFVLFGLTALGRLLWLEYRDEFGWVRGGKSDAGEYKNVFGSGSLKVTLRSLFEVLYTWNNTFLLLGALVYIPCMKFLAIDALVTGFVVVAILNNLPWIAIVYSGFRNVRNEQVSSGDDSQVR